MTASEKDDQPQGTPPLGEDHWSKSRAGENEEALEYYRERSKAPGVEDGGGMRNHYCFECDGVIDVRSDIGIEQNFDSAHAHSNLLLFKACTCFAES